MSIDFPDALHGRAPAVVESSVFIVTRHWSDAQGDGDLRAIGMGDAINAAARVEDITMIVLNNANCGIEASNLHRQRTSDKSRARRPMGATLIIPASQSIWGSYWHQ